MWKRCSELEAIGVVKAVGEKICSETRQTSTAWDVTDYIPCSEDYAKLRTSRATFWIVFSEKSGRMGCASPDKQDVAKVHEAWLKKPGYQDAKIFKAQVVKPE